MIERRLIAVVGPTGTGKSAVAVDLARRYGGAIVNADSRQVYRGMDIGTAKPSQQERLAVPHHLYDVAEPAEGYSLALYLQQARDALLALWEAGTLPWLVGGTGQYAWALLEHWTVPEVPPDEALRAELAAFAEEQGTEALHSRLATIDPLAASRIEVANVRRVVRALEVHHHTGRPISEWQQKSDPEFEFLVLGLDLPDDVLLARISDRVRRMYADGFVDEVRALMADGLPLDAPAMSSIGYREAARCIAGEIDESQAIDETILATKRLVRRQRQWFRKTDERIHWGASTADFDPLVADFLGS